MQLNRKIHFHVEDDMLYDRIIQISAEYSVSADMFINAAVRKMICDIDFIRNLRIYQDWQRYVNCKNEYAVGCLNVAIKNIGKGGKLTFYSISIMKGGVLSE